MGTHVKLPHDLISVQERRGQWSAGTAHHLTYTSLSLPLVDHVIVQLSPVVVANTVRPSEPTSLQFCMTITTGRGFHI